MLCIGLIVPTIASFGGVAWTEVEGGGACTHFGSLEFLLEEMYSETDYMNCMIVAVAEKSKRHGCIIIFDENVTNNFEYREIMQCNEHSKKNELNSIYQNLVF